MLLSRWLYRTRQAVHYLRAAPDAASLERARRILSPPLWRLFLRMTPSEQAHALGVLETLQRRGETHPDLLQAALLHDAGKAEAPPLRLWERALIVLTAPLWRKAHSLWAASPPRGWRRPFVIAALHPLWGAQQAQKAGASQRVVSLILNHQEKLNPPPQNEFERLLEALQAADDEN